jgi:hypothetical protein
MKEAGIILTFIATFVAGAGLLALIVWMGGGG